MGYKAKTFRSKKISFLCKKVLLYCLKNTVLHDMSPFIIHLFVITDIPRWLALSPLYIWILIFFTRPHKVNNFVYMNCNFFTRPHKVKCFVYKLYITLSHLTRVL